MSIYPVSYLKAITDAPSKTYLALVVFLILNGWSYDFFTWASADYDWSTSPAHLFILLVIVRGLLKERFVAFSPWVAALCFTLLLIPSSTLSWLALCILAMQMALANPKKDLHLLIGLFALSELCEAVLFKLISQSVLEAETQAVTRLIQFYSESAYSIDNMIILPESHALSMSTGCSALLNVSFIAIVWSSAYLFVNDRLPKLLPLLGLVLVFFLLNSVRIFFMALDPSWYEFVHDGFGKQLFDGLIVLLLITPFITRGKAS